MKTDRPVNLNLFTISFPFVAIVSITHRITGVALFVGIGFALYALQIALASPQGFAEAQALLKTPLAIFIFVGLLFVMVFHVLAGLKHLMLDFHMGDTFDAARNGAVFVAVGSVVVTAVLGAMLW